MSAIKQWFMNLFRQVDDPNEPVRDSRGQPILIRECGDGLDNTCISWRIMTANDPLALKAPDVVIPQDEGHDFWKQYRKGKVA